MPKITEQTIAAVKGRADLRAVAERAGVALKKCGADDFVGRCPFHEEKTGSFHVHPEKDFFKCFGCGKGGKGIFALVMAREGLTFPQAVERLAGEFGVMIEYEDRPVARRKAGVGGAEAAAGAAGFVLPPGVDEVTARRAMRNYARHKAEREAEERLERERMRALAPGVEAREMADWPGCVRERWEAGLAGENFGAAAMQEVADGRGWPVHWVESLVESQLIARPALPWDDGRREIAFRVDAPILAHDGDRDFVSGLRAVGYHQRFVGRDGRKTWVYVPYFPAAEDAEGRAKRLTDFQRQLRAVGAERGGAEGEGLVQGVPFFMGAARGVRWCVIAEGQWDAITLAGAAGWLDGDTSWPEGVAVMGVRGASGVEVLLAHWARWFFWESPEVLVLADNDAAGRRWDTPEAVAPGVAVPPTFANKLRAAGAKRVEIARVRPEFGKDFNDFYRAKRPTAHVVRDWLGARGFRGGV